MAGIALGLLLAPTGGAWAAQYVWDFDAEEEAAEWTLSGLTQDAVTNSLLVMTATRGNPMLFTPSVDVNAADQKAVSFRMRLGQGIPSKGCLLFITDTQPQYTDEALVLFDCASDGQFHDYEVDMSEDPLWTGTVLQLRFQPFYVGWPIPEEQRIVELDRFAILSWESFAGEIDRSPFGLLTRDVVTPHIPWAVPYAQGPVKVLAIPKHREIVELAQRLSLDYTTWSKFEAGDAGAGGYAGLNDLYHGPYARGLTASYAELTTKLATDHDCILIGPQRWGRTFDWPSLPESLKESMLEKVALGAGLIYVRPLAETRSDLESRMDQPMDSPANLAAGVPFEGLTVLDQDMQGNEWLQCFALGAGRVAIVDYPSESFGHWESERSFRRGMSSPFTPDVQYDYRAKPLYYEYYQSLLAKLVLWASNREGPVALTSLGFENGSLQAVIRNTGAAREVNLKIVVRDADDTEEFVHTGTLGLAAGDVPFAQPIDSLKSGGHFGDVWVREGGQTLAWGSTYFQTESDINITAITTDKSSYRNGDTVQGHLVLDGMPPTGVTARLTLTDSLGRVLRRDDMAADADDIPFAVPLAGAEVCLHMLQAALVREDNVLCAETVDVILREEPELDDFKFQFWTPSANNDMPSRYLLSDLHRRGLDVGFLGYLYAQGAEQLRPLLRNTVAANLDAALFAFSLSVWNAGSDPTATVSPRCLTRPAYREGIFTVLQQHAATAKDFTTYGYGLGDEAGICGHGQDFCFSPTCLEYTRNYLGGQFDSLGELNQEWGTSFAAWAEVTPMTREEARQHGNFAPWVDHRMAMEDMFAGLVADCADAIGQQDPGGMAGTEGITGDGMYWNGGESSTVGYDFGQIIPAGKFWVVYFQHYPQIEFLRSFASPGSVRGTYATPFEESPGGYFEDAWQNEQTARFVPWFGLFNGMNGTMYWGAMYTEWHGFFSPDFRPTPWSQHITETMAEIKGGIAKLILNCRRDNTGVAIHYSPTSFHVETIQEGRERVESPKAFCRLLEDIGLQYDFVSRQQMAQDKLSQYKALILPYSYAISAEEAQQIRGFVANGGTIIADGAAGSMNGHGRLVSENMLAGVPLHTMTNAVWTYSGSEVRNGEAGRQVRAELVQALEAAGVHARFRIVPVAGGELPGCEVVGFADGNAEYIGILQGREYVRKQDEDHTPVPVTIELPDRFHVYDVRTGTYLGRTDRIATGIAPAVAKLYALLPCRVAALSVTGISDVYETGATVDYAVSSATLPAAGIPQVFRVDVRPPGAGMIDLLNWSFENPVLADSLYRQLDDSGNYAWYDGNGAATWPGANICNPSAALFPGGIPHGANAAWLDTRDPGTTNSVVQRDILPIDETQSYTLTVKVGRSATEAFPGDYYARLLKGSAVAAASISTVLPASDGWKDITVTYEPLPGDEGKMLGIQVGNLTGVSHSYMWVDDVRLSHNNRLAPNEMVLGNWSFENPELADGLYEPLDDSGNYAWYDGNGAATWPGVYIYNPSAAAFPGGVPDGANAVQLDVRDPPTANSVVQRNLLPVDETQSYTLTVKVGRSAIQAFPGDYYVRMLKDTDVAAEFHSSAAPASGSWVEATVTYHPVPGDGGKLLGVEMGNRAGATDAYMWFDDVRLTRGEDRRTLFVVE